MGGFMKTLFIVGLIFSLNAFSKDIKKIDLFNQKRNYAQKMISHMKSHELEMKLSAMKYIPVVESIAREMEVDPVLVVSIMWTESHFKNEAKSHVGAKGLMQIMPKTKKFLFSKVKNFNSLASSHLNKGVEYKDLEDIILATYYVKSLLKRFDSVELAIVAYNMGPNWVSKQLKSNQSVGVNNLYLNKVKNKMMIALAE